MRFVTKMLALETIFLSDLYATDEMVHRVFNVSTLTNLLKEKYNVLWDEEFYWALHYLGIEQRIGCGVVQLKDHEGEQRFLWTLGSGGPRGLTRRDENVVSHTSNFNPIEIFEAMHENESLGRDAMALWQTLEGNSVEQLVAASERELHY